MKPMGEPSTWARPRLGVSACLLGHPVRYDGGHKRCQFLAEDLARFVEWVPVCPEVEAGLGCPREPMHLVLNLVQLRLVGLHTGDEYTDMLESCAASKVAELAGAGLCGFVFKSRSPSCGLARVPIHDEKGRAVALGQGIFAQRLRQALPLLPVAEEGNLAMLTLARESFLERVFVYRRLLVALAATQQPAGLIAFHATAKFLLLAHGPAHYRELERVVAEATRWTWDELSQRYARLFMAALGIMPTCGRHANVLQHAVSYLRDTLGPSERRELLALIEAYRRGAALLQCVIDRLRACIARHGGPRWLCEQIYLEPYPRELGPRQYI